ncbi:MAG: SCP2 sterol-binding domain-containing protein [Acidimicrobiales bacterium]|nr:SCP2 sterol-binding domain-containing protein [Acidimicrobiales bacterium]
MADIYTSAWYDAVRDTINSKVDAMTGVPDGGFTVAVDIQGDGRSPYFPADGARHFLIRIDDGRCEWYREVDSTEAATHDHDDVDLDYRFIGPASVFDDIAAGLIDPIDAALGGQVKVRGDMRFLMRQAEHVQVLLEAYTNGVSTDWPQGRPPYGEAG